jgi:superfamily II DNA or RNA helicase
MELRLDPDCVTARIVGRISPDLLHEVAEALSCYEPGYFYDWRFKTHRWDGKTYFFDRATCTFPAGHLPLVERVLTHFRAPVTIRDDRPPLPWPVGTTCPTLATSTQPRATPFVFDPDQVAAVNQLLAVGRGCALLPTSWGKTACAAALMKVTPGRCLFLVNRKGLMSQTAERLEGYLGETVGRIGGGLRDLRRRVTVATIQALAYKLSTFAEQLFPAQQLLVMDECHVAATQALEILKRIHAPARIGLSATIRESPRRLYIQAYLGPILVESTLTELVAVGRAAAPEIRMYRVGGLIDEAPDFGPIYQDGVVHHRERNDLIVQLAREHAAQGQRVIVLVWDLAHGRALQDALSSRFTRVPFLYGQTDLNTLTQTKRRFESGELPIMVCSTIFDFGQDLPSINVFIMAAGMRSPLRTIQRLGRAVRRKATGENRALIIDFYDQGHPLLQRQADERRLTYQRKGYPPTLLDAPDAAAQPA